MDHIFRRAGRLTTIVAVALLAHTAKAKEPDGCGRLPTPGTPYLPCEMAHHLGDTGPAGPRAQAPQDAPRWVGTYTAWTIRPDSGDARTTWGRLVKRLGGHEVDGLSDGSTSTGTAWVAVVTASTTSAFAKAAQNVAPLQQCFEKNVVVTQSTPSFGFRDGVQGSDLVAITGDTSLPACQQTLKEHGLIDQAANARFDLNPVEPGGALIVRWSRASASLNENHLIASSITSAGRTSMLSEQMLILGQPQGSGVLVQTFRARRLNDQP